MKIKNLFVLLSLVFIISNAQAQTGGMTSYDVVGALNSKQYKKALAPKNWKGKSTDADSRYGYKVIDQEIYILSDNEQIFPTTEIPKKDIRVLVGDELFFIVVVTDTVQTRVYMYHRKKGFIKNIPFKS